MPSASGNLPPKTMREYEVLVIPQSPTGTSNPYQPPPSPQLRTKRICCNRTNGTVFWIPDGYRPVLVRTEDLPLLVGTEYNPPSPNNPGYASAEYNLPSPNNSGYA